MAGSLPKVRTGPDANSRHRHSNPVVNRGHTGVGAAIRFITSAPVPVLRAVASPSNDALASRYVNDQSTRPAADFLLVSHSASIMSGGGS